MIFKQKIIGMKENGMSLIGNSIRGLLTVLLGLNMSYAEQSNIELTKFSAGTPAKASEVNGNFESIKAYIEQLEGKLEQLTGTINKIPVYGDGELIGHTNNYPSFINSNVKVMTEFGEFQLERISNNKIAFASIHQFASYSIVFSDNDCSSPFLLHDSIEYKEYITPEKVVTRNQVILHPNSKAADYYIPKGTVILENINPQSYFNNTQSNCEAIMHNKGDTVIPLIKYSGAFKTQFDRIRIGDN